MKNIILFLQGFIIGVGNVIPGVSGSVLAIIFGLYEKMVASICSLKEFKKNFKFLSILCLGIALAIILGSNVIKILLTNHYLHTMMFFIGMMIPGIIPLFMNINNKDVNWKNIAICTSVVCLLFILSIIDVDSYNISNTSYLHEFISLFLCGLIDAACTIIPGISGSAILMLVGYYELIISATANILTMSDLFMTIRVLVPFYLGTGIGIILISKLIHYLFNNHRVLTFMLIIVFSTYSLILLLVNVMSMIGNFSSFLSGIIFLGLGFFATYSIDKLLNK